MKNTGVVRKVDELGRIVIPIELRRNLGIDEKDPIEIYMDDERIILQKYVPHRACSITGIVSPKNKEYGNKKINLSPEGAKSIMEELQDYMGAKI